MMKRVAERQLTLENCEDEEEYNEEVVADSPQLASSDVLKNRKRIVGKRRSDLNSPSSDGQTKASAFAGFKGFNVKPKNANEVLCVFGASDGQPLMATSMASMTTSLTTSLSSMKSPLISMTTTTSPSMTTTSFASLTKPLSSLAPQTNGTEAVGQEKSVSDVIDEDSDDLYNEKLKTLNKSFVKHLNKYMIEESVYDLTQICKEYIDYHKKIVSEMESTDDTDKCGVPAVLSLPTMAKTSISSSQTSGDTGFESQSSSKTNSTPSQSSTLFASQGSIQFSSQSSAGGLFSFQPSVGFSSLTKSESLSPQTSGRGLASSLAISGGHSFKAPLFANKASFAVPDHPLSFSPSKTSSPLVSGVTTGDNEAEESEEPPKVESIEHKEPNSVYVKKCRLFFQKSKEWQSKGVGYLYIKKEPTATSAQLLIRADNKLGNILLNISLTESLPINRLKDNNGVMLTCIPNPPLDPKAGKATEESAVVFLVRVKKGDNDELYENLTKYKSQ